MLLTETLDPPPRLLCGPGPSDVEPAVLAAMRRSMLGHLDPAFHAVLDEVVELLRAVWRMPDGDVLAFPSTGTTAMDAGLANLLEPGETVIVAEAGYFGRRMGDIAERHGARVVRVTAPWGETVPNEALLDALDRHPGARLVAVVHAETSTGALHPLRELGSAMLGTDALLLADCVTSLGGIPLDVGAWGVDYAYSCTQKCLAAPPGMAPVAISPHAWRRIRERRAPVPFASTSSCCGATGSSGRPSTTTRRRSSASTRCTRRCGWCSRRGSRRAGRGTRPPARACRTRSARAGSSSSPTRSARWRRSPRSGCPTGSTARPSRRGCWPATGSRSAAGSGPDAPPMWRIGLMGPERDGADRRPRARRARRGARASRRSSSAGSWHSPARVPRVVVTRALPEPALAALRDERRGRLGLRRGPRARRRASCTPRSAAPTRS